MSSLISSWRFLMLFASLCVSLSIAQELPFLIFNGKVVNNLGQPVKGAQVQFWQTDTSGNYNHPAAGVITLDPTFQYFGTATTDSNGDFQFLTRRPGIYPSRPVTHIHFKVWLEGVDILTSQFYFRDENTSYSDMLILDLVEAPGVVEDSSIPTFSTSKTVVLDLGLGGSGPFTPRQQAGPFYPTLDFFGFGSNMVNVTADQQPGTPDPTIAPAGPQESPAPSSSADNVNTSAPSVKTSPADESSASPSSAPIETPSPSTSTGQTSPPLEEPNKMEKDSSANKPIAAMISVVVVAVFGLLQIILV